MYSLDVSDSRSRLHAWVPLIREEIKPSLSHEEHTKCTLLMRKAVPATHGRTHETYSLVREVVPGVYNYKSAIGLSKSASESQATPAGPKVC